MHPAIQVNRHAGRRYLWQTALYVIAGAALLIMAVPFVWMLLTSIRTTYTPLDVFMNPIPSSITLVNYQKALSTTGLGRALFNSVVVSVFIVIFNVIFDSMAGYAFAKKKFAGKEALFAVVLLMMIVPFHVTLVPLFMILAHMKWINTFQGVIMPHAVSGFGIFMMTQFMKAIPQDLLDAAAIDGAHELDIFTRVVLPLTRPALAALAILQFLASWNMFMWPLIITTSGEMRTIQVALALFTDRYGTSNWGLTMAGSAVALLPMLLVYVALQKQFVRGITMSGMKF